MRPLRFDQHKLDSRQNFYVRNDTSSENTVIFITEITTQTWKQANLLLE